MGGWYMTKVIFKANLKEYILLKQECIL